MRWLLVILPFFAFGQTITLTPIGGASVNSIPVSVTHIIPGATTGTITQLTSNIPADRGQTSTVIWSTANSDQGNTTVTFPTGYAPVVGSTSYSTATIHANAWLAFGGSTYSGYNGSASQPNVPTLHFTSVNNGSTDNNMSHVSTETYTDSYFGDVFRIRYEGSYKYSVTGINTKIDLIFPKNDPAKMIVVLRQFLADGSNQEQIGLSNGSTWLASNLITNASYTTGQAWVLTSVVNAGGTQSAGTQSTGINGQVVFSNPNNYQYEVTIDLSNEPSIMTNAEMNYLMYKKAGLSPLTDWDYYTCNMDNLGGFDWDDIQYGYDLLNTGLYWKSYIFTETEKADIEANPQNDYYNIYSPTQTLTIQNQNKFYIMATGKHKTTTNNLFKIE